MILGLVVLMGMGLSNRTRVIAETENVPNPTYCWTLLDCPGCHTVDHNWYSGAAQCPGCGRDTQSVPAVTFGWALFPGPCSEE